MAFISPFKVPTSASDMPNGFSNEAHFANEVNAANFPLWFDREHKQPDAERKAQLVGKVDDVPVYGVSILDDATVIPMGLSRMGHTYRLIRLPTLNYYKNASLADSDLDDRDRPITWHFPANAAAVAHFSDGAVLATANLLSLPVADGTMRSFVAYLLRHGLPHPSQLPFWISVRNWRYRSIRHWDTVLLFVEKLRKRVQARRQQTL